MALDSVAKRLNELAETDSPLQRSRAMAQLWGDIRTASPDDRRRLAHVLADRFAPALVERFETIAGIEGPEFIKLVRDLIDVDAGDIRAVISDLGEAAVGPPDRDETEPRGRAVEDTSEDAEPDRDEAIDRLFERITEEVGDATGRPGADDVEALLGDGIEARSLAQAVEALEDLPESDRRPSAFDAAKERLHQIEVEEDRADAARPVVEKQPPDVSRPPAVAWQPPAPDPSTTGDTDRLRERVAATPDGWKRRRLLSAAIRRGEVDTETALELSLMLSNRIDRGWIAGDLIERGVPESDWTLFGNRGLPPHLLRRLYRSD